MRILIDATSAREGGGVTYILNILPALLRQGRGHEYHVLLSGLYQEKLKKQVPQGVRLIKLRISKVPAIRWCHLQLLIPRLLHKGEFDLFFTISEISAFYTPCPRVVQVQNLKLYTPLNVLPLLSQRWRLAIRSATGQPLAYLTTRGAERILFVSESLRQTAMERMRIPLEKTKVVYHGLSPSFGPSNKESLSDLMPDHRPYMLTVSSVGQHKNIETLLQGFAGMTVKGIDENLQLLIAGATLDAKLHRALLVLANSLGIADRVEFLGRMDPESLATLYRQAKVFVFPSRLESFGIPLIEAMACGVPVVASSLPVCREICQDAASYFTPGDPESLAEKVLTLLSNGHLVDSMIEKGRRRAAEFSWDKTARQLVEIFEEVKSKLGG